MNAIELRAKNVEELQAEFMAASRELFSLRIQRSIQQAADKSHLFRKLKRNIARIKTILAEKAKEGKQ